MLRLEDLVNANPGAGNRSAGSVRNDSGPTATDGTEIVDRTTNDLYYALVSVMERAGISPDNSDETEVSSQFLEALIRSTALIGEVRSFAGVFDPQDGTSSYNNYLQTLGWIPCDGSTKNVGDYPLLASCLGNSWGDTGDVNTFNLPDFREEKGVLGGTSGFGVGTNIGTRFDGENKEHDHTMEDAGNHFHYGFRASRNQSGSPDLSDEPENTAAYNGSGQGNSNDRYVILGLETTANSGRTSNAGDHIHLINFEGTSENIAAHTRVAYYIKAKF